MAFYHTRYPWYDCQRHKGYGTAHHAALLVQHGPSILHRFSFAPVAAWGEPGRTPIMSHGDELAASVAC